jgi:hypothetical protein
MITAAKRLGLYSALRACNAIRFKSNGQPRLTVETIFLKINRKKCTIRIRRGFTVNLVVNVRHQLDVEYMVLQLKREWQEQQNLDDRMRLKVVDPWLLFSKQSMDDDDDDELLHPYSPDMLLL